MRILSCVALGLITASIAAGAASYTSSSVTPPEPAREFRGVWIATVNNIDWPSRPGLSTADQKRELIAILDRAARLKLNAVILQVRPECDALYASPIEPWSEYLTGTMGKAPEPFYDPLAFAIQEAHERGMELHAWINPFRALHSSSQSPIASNHVSKTHPGWVRRYGKSLWLDPGEPEASAYTLHVILDVVKRYDIDGLHLDDYFYPYPGDAGGPADFPDDSSWERLGSHSGLARDEWRRKNVDTFIKRVYDAVKAVKPWVKFGVSPPGIWRPGYPPQIKGADAYAKIFADSRKWLANGWLDYLAPQLYWPIEQKEQSFQALLGWWAAQNARGRHVWPGIASYKATDWKPDEIPRQIQLTRKQPGVTGYILYSASSLMRNAALDSVLERDLDREPALVPASPWLGSARPGRPKAYVIADAGKWKLFWAPRGTNVLRWWVLQTKQYGDWKTRILPAEVTSEVLTVAPEALAVTAVDRDGNAGAPCVLQERKVPTARPGPGRR